MILDITVPPGASEDHALAEIISALEYAFDETGSEVVSVGNKIIEAWNQVEEARTSMDVLGEDDTDATECAIQARLEEALRILGQFVPDNYGEED
jgi:heterodisulfide reductase subunit C